jgi:hypothetical protein
MLKQQFICSMKDVFKQVSKFGVERTASRFILKNCRVSGSHFIWLVAPYWLLRLTGTGFLEAVFGKRVVLKQLCVLVCRCICELEWLQREIKNINMAYRNWYSIRFTFYYYCANIGGSLKPVGSCRWCVCAGWSILTFLGRRMFEWTGCRNSIKTRVDVATL